MPTETFKERLKKLVFNKKLILIGSFLTTISVFMPWYQDRDRFNTGDMFLGISGPLYLAGIIILLASVFSFGLIMMQVMEKPIPKLPLKEIHFHLFASAVSLLLLVLATSVYLHPKFGLNITDKSIAIGMFIAFGGTLLVIIGGILGLGKKEITFEEEGVIKPLIDIDIQREKGEIKKADGEEFTYTIPLNKPHQETIDEIKNTNDVI